VLLKSFASAHALVLDNVFSMFSNITYIWQSFNFQINSIILFASTPWLPFLVWLQHAYMLNVTNHIYWAWRYTSSNLCEYLCWHLILGCDSIHCIFVEFLAKCMFQWTPKYHMCWLVNACVISWDVNNVNFELSII
jgi:hypothetical protein